MTGSPIDELLEAINNALSDLADKRAAADEAFVKRTDEHNSEVQRLEQAIANTQQEIEDI